MADTEAAPVAANAPPAQSPTKKEKKAKNPRAKPTHPPTSEMVNNAIKGLKERGGSSLQAIKKYIAANYKVDAEKVAPFIKKYLKSAVVSGALVQTKGKGASGSFKLAGSGGAKQSSADKKKTAVKSRRSPAKKAASGDKPKAAKKTTPKAKKTSAEKKSPKKVPTGEKKVAKLSGSTVTVAATTTVKAKSPSKAKKSNKAGPTKKPKAPKPKTAKSPAASKAKKAASPKRKK